MDRPAIKIACLLVGLVAANAERALALPAAAYDVESLAWMATDVVEGELVRLNDRITEPAEVRVTAAHKGSRVPGETLRVFLLSDYRKEGKDIWRTVPLVPKDRLVLFLGPVPEKSGLGVVNDPDARIVVPSGIRLVKDGKAVPFVQFENPGPVVAADVKWSPGLPAPAMAEFRTRITEAIKAAEGYATRFEAPPSPDDVTWLLDLLRERSRLPREESQRSIFESRDKVAEEACARLANLHDLKGLDAAAFLNLPVGGCRGLIESGFAFPEGREFLLARVGDEKLDVSQCVRYAEILRDAGRDYHASASDISRGGVSFLPVEAKDNAAYLTRVAKVAGDTDSEAVGLVLLDALARFSSGLPGRADDDPIRADLRGALPSLLELHRKTSDERARFGVERVVARVSRTAYDSLESKCGPVLSLVTPSDSPAGKSQAGDRYVRFDYAIVPLDHEPTEPPQLILTHLAMGKESIVPAGLKFRGRNEAIASTGVRLPRGLAPGPYRVALRFRRNGHVVSDGYGFETEL